jgi:pyruvate dehydrogenase E2 component (dihydrolipoamide acetyltransferase)
MPVEVIMPKVDMDMASGKIMSWHVGEGEAVAKGAPLFDIETDKAAMEIEAPDAGVLHFAAPEGSEIPIGEAVAWLYADGEAIGEQPKPFAISGANTPAPAPAAAPAPDHSSEVASVVSRPSDAEAVPTADRPRATPSARRLAREAGLGIDAIPGTGPRGRVQAEDVRSALNSVATLSAPPGFTSETGPLAVTRSKGGTGTPVVLLHGFASDAPSWAPLEPYLKHRPLIRIELPCHGKSPRRRFPGFADLVKELRHAFDALQLDQAHLIGHSLGGALSLALTDTRPRSIASLTLIAPAGLGPEINGSALTGICRATRAESLGPWLKSLVAEEKLVTESYIRLAMAGRSDPALRAAQVALADTLFPDGVQAFDLRAALDRVEVPTRIIWGKRDAIIPWNHALRAPGRVALHLFDGIGHMPQIEQPDLVGQILRAAV